MIRAPSERPLYDFLNVLLADEIIYRNCLINVFAHTKERLIEELQSHPEGGFFKENSLKDVIETN